MDAGKESLQAARREQAAAQAEEGSSRNGSRQLRKAQLLERERARALRLHTKASRDFAPSVWSARAGLTW